MTRQIEAPETFANALHSVIRGYKDHRLNALKFFKALCELTDVTSGNVCVKAAIIGVTDSMTEILQNDGWTMEEFINDLEGTLEYLQGTYDKEIVEKTWEHDGTVFHLVES